MKKKMELPNGWERVRRRVEDLVGTKYEVYVDDGGENNYRFYAGPITKIVVGRKYIYFHVAWWATTFAGFRWTLESDKPLVFRHEIKKRKVGEDFITYVSNREQHTFDGRSVIKKPEAARA